MFRPYWAAFHWNLKSLPADCPRPQVKSIELREATVEDAANLWSVMQRSFNTELAWGLLLEERTRFLRRTVYDGLLDRKVEFLVVEHGRRIIAGSGLLKNPQSPVHLVTGIWVMEEYRCRGLGLYLLHASLKRLAESGLEDASVITRSNTAAAKYLYPKLDSHTVKLEAYPELKSLD
ncbi:MAG: GNAT family N-acetyltransferase [Candidatus Methylacidiphilales bacterium]|nr:GNAT family N-acetyltransferase [Candidatus Methylacidiphilales bacterium]